MPTCSAAMVWATRSRVKRLAPGEYCGSIQGFAYGRRRWAEVHSARASSIAVLDTVLVPRCL